MWLPLPNDLQQKSVKSFQEQGKQPLPSQVNLLMHHRELV